MTLLEGHENIGGSASWFNRGAFSFDAGATTLSGVREHEPLGKLFKLLGEVPPLQKVDPGIVFHLSDGKIISYRHDFEMWMQELEGHFPNLSHRDFWKKVYSLNSKAWGLLGNLNSFPFQKLEDFWEVLKAPQYYHLYPYLLVSTDMMLKHYGLDNKSYVELVNGILLISTQTEAPQTPFLIGAMGLAYPQETYAPVGGMEGLMEYFEKKCIDLGVKVMKKTPVKNIQELGAGPSDRVILNIPYWNLPDLFTGSQKSLLEKSVSEKKTAWGAFTLYFGVKSHCQELYQQIHLNHPLVKNYFVSFSIPHDVKRAPEGHQAVTISTHVNAEEWFGLDRTSYKMKKTLIQELILNDFKQRFETEELKFLSSGTPKTFFRYTGRLSGYVGGLPFRYGMNPWKLKGHDTVLKNVYQVGDTTFPGQGIVGVVAGAFALDAKREL